MREIFRGGVLFQFPSLFFILRGDQQALIGAVNDDANNNNNNLLFIQRRTQSTHLISVPFADARRGVGPDSNLLQVAQRSLEKPRQNGEAAAKVEKPQRKSPFSMRSRFLRRRKKPFSGSDFRFCGGKLITPELSQSVNTEQAGF